MLALGVFFSTTKDGVMRGDGEKKGEERKGKGNVRTQAALNVM